MILRSLPFVALFAAAFAAPAGAAVQSATVITAPAPLPARHDRVRVFLGGSIDMGHAADWQQSVAAALGGEDVVILNPRRPDWNPAWKPEADDPHFREQVEWELAALDSADIIVLYLAPGSKSPVSLLEMGLHAQSGKLILLCPSGYWRKGNVDITAERYGIEQVADFDALIAAVRARIAALHRARG